MPDYYGATGPTMNHVKRLRALSVGVLAAAIGVLATLGPVEARRQDLADARTIVDRYVAAIGGAEAFAGVSSMRARGTLEITGQQISGALEILSARPSRMRLRAEMAGIGTVEAGYDGTLAWERNPLAGPSVLSGRRLQEAAEDARFDAPLHLDEHVREMTTVAALEFDGRPAHQVDVILASGTERTEFYDAETGLLIGSAVRRETPLGVVPVETVMRDYQQFGPLRQPTVIVQRQLGIEQVARLTSFEYNDVPDSAFDPPADVKALAP